MSEVRLPRALIHELVPGTNALKDRGRLNPVKVSYTLNNESLSTAQIQLREDDIELKQHDLVEIYGENGSVGIFRVVRRGRKIKGVYTFQFNHAFDTLSDAIIPGTETVSGTVREIMTELLNCQTNGVGDENFWQLGTVECNETYSFDNSYNNVYEQLKEIQEKFSGCVYTFDFTTFPWTLNFVSKSPEVIGTLRLNRNIEEIEISEDDTEQCTKLYLSIDSKDDPNIAEDERTVTYRTVEDLDAVHQWGVIEKAVGIETKEIGSSEAAINAWIDHYMEEHRNPGLSISITGEMFAQLTGDPADRIVLGKICKTILKEYNTVFNERVVSITVPDALRNPRHFTASLASKKLTAGGAISKLNKETKKSASRGGRRIQEVSDYFSDYLGHYIEENDQHWKSVYWDTYNGLTSRIEQTASYWQAEFDDQYNRLHGFVEITAQHWQSTYEDGYSGLVSQIEQTAAYWRSLLADTYSGLYGLVEQTAQHWQSTLADTYRGLSSRVEQTAAYWKSELANAYSGLSSRVTQTASSWEAKIRGVADENGNVTSASIAVAINNAGEGVATIDANKVYIGNQKSTTVINGKLNASDVTADYLKAKIASIPILTVQAVALTGGLSGSGDIRTSGVIGGYNMQLAGQDMRKALISASVTGNVLTLKNVDGETTTFSRATSLSAAWDGNRKFTVSASPQDVNRYTTIFSAVPKSDISWSGTTGTATLKASIGDAESSVTVGTVTVNGEDVYNSVTVPASNIYEYQTAYYNSTTHNTTVYVEAKASNGKTGRQTFHVSGADAYAAGRLSGWNAACDKIFRSGNTIYCPKKNNLDGAATAKYTASYTASSYTKEVYKASSNSYSPGVYVPSSYTASSYSASSYSASSYTKESHSYTASSHSHTGAKMKLGISTYTSSFNMTLKNFSGAAQFTKDADSYTPSKHSYTASSYTASSYTASSYTKEKYTASAYKASSNSYTASSLTPSAYKESTFSWVEY